MKKVLIVDDSETIRQQVAVALANAGFAVVEAGDGVEGLERIAEHDDISMVIIDVNMPRLGGLDMLDRLMTTPKTSKLPVLMLTTEVQPAMMQRAKSAGAKGWVIKPVKMDLLTSAVTKLTQ